VRELLVEGDRLLTRVRHQDRGVFIERFTAEEGPQPYGAGDHQRNPESEHADADDEDAADRAEGREAVLPDVGTMSASDCECKRRRSRIGEQLGRVPSNTGIMTSCSLR
jgi:hypothetical protein